MLFNRTRQVDTDFIWKCKYVRMARNCFIQKLLMYPKTNARRVDDKKTFLHPQNTYPEHTHH